MACLEDRTCLLKQYGHFSVLCSNMTLLGSSVLPYFLYYMRRVVEPHSHLRGTGSVREAGFYRAHKNHQNDFEKIYLWAKGYAVWLSYNCLHSL